MDGLVLRGQPLQRDSSACSDIRLQVWAGSLSEPISDLSRGVAIRRLGSARALYSRGHGGMAVSPSVVSQHVHGVSVTRRSGKVLLKDRMCWEWLAAVIETAQQGSSRSGG